MFEAIKGLLTLRGVLGGYKTYISAFAMLLLGVSGIALDVVAFIDGASFSATWEAMQPDLVKIIEAFGLAGLRKGIASK